MLTTVKSAVAPLPGDGVKFNFTGKTFKPAVTATAPAEETPVTATAIAAISIHSENRVNLFIFRHAFPSNSAISNTSLTRKKSGSRMYQ